MTILVAFTYSCLSPAINTSSLKNVALTKVILEQKREIFFQRASLKYVSTSK